MTEWCVLVRGVKKIHCTFRNIDWRSTTTAFSLLKAPACYLSIHTYEFIMTLL